MKDSNFLGPNLQNSKIQTLKATIFSPIKYIKQKTTTTKDKTKHISNLGFPRMKEILILIRHNSYIFEIKPIKALLPLIHLSLQFLICSSPP